ncbi:MAG: hypothetical protein RJB63_602 [Actinomycetota bacterium]|jgi:hypothetical protein
MDSVYSNKEQKPEFWFNLKTLKVEVGRKSAAPYRVGPFATEQEAKAALSTLAERSAKWDTEED